VLFRRINARQAIDVAPEYLGRRHVDGTPAGRFIVNFTIAFMSKRILETREIGLNRAKLRQKHRGGKYEEPGFTIRALGMMRPYTAFTKCHAGRAGGKAEPHSDATKYAAAAHL
jgi:hypothetical protein